MTLDRRFMMGLALPVILSASACAQNPPPPPEAPPPPAPMAAASPPAAAPTATTPPTGVTMEQPPVAPTAAAPPQAPPAANTPPPQSGVGESSASNDQLLAGLDDPQIVGAALAMDDQSIRLGQMGENKATDRSVRRFAHYISTTASSLQGELKAVSTKMSVTPLESAASTDARARGSRGVGDLQGASGAEFDRLFVDQVIGDLSRNVDMLDAMASTAKSADIQAELHRTSLKMRGALHEAQALHDRLQSKTG